jgi:hypothetical protein
LHGHRWRPRSGLAVSDREGVHQTPKYLVFDRRDAQMGGKRPAVPPRADARDVIIL